MTAPDQERQPAPPPYGTIVFDCDSTLATIEGIEFLARDRAAEIAELTSLAMRGEVPLEQVFGKRLELIQPTRAAVDAIGAAYIEHALPHGIELVAALRALDKRVVVISGGLTPAVEVLASWLGIDEVQAVGIRFNEDGAYAGFDETSPMARAGGKLDAARALLAGPEALPPLCLIGDGATDLEASPALARFVAFSAIEHRPSVVAAADAVCDVPDLAALLPLLTSPAEREQLAGDPAHAPLLQASRGYA